MLETMARIVPGLGWLLPIPFYFMELLVGLVQALVFMLLTAVFTLLICHHEEPAGSGGAALTGDSPRANDRHRRKDNPMTGSITSALRPWAQRSGSA